MFDNLKLNSKDNLNEIIDIVCSSCKCNKWLVFLELDPIEKKIYLCYSCATEECRQEITNGDTNKTPIWGKVDITGQGYDPPEWRLDSNKAN